MRAMSDPSEWDIRRLQNTIETTDDDGLRIVCKRELLRRKGEERNWQFTGPAEHPSRSIFKNHTLHTIQKF